MRFTFRQISGVNRYFKNSQQLRACVVLVDATRGVATHDLRTLKLLQRLKVPTFVALTKADLLRPEELAASHNIIRDDVAGFQNVVTSSFGNLSGGQQDAQTKVRDQVETHCRTLFRVVFVRAKGYKCVRMLPARRRRKRMAL